MSTRKQRQVELAIADQAFRDALKGGDSWADALAYANLMVESARLAAG